jgi:hypothetical protein
VLEQYERPDPATVRQLVKMLRRMPPQRNVKDREGGANMKNLVIVLLTSVSLAGCYTVSNAEQ